MVRIQITTSLTFRSFGAYLFLSSLEIEASSIYTVHFHFMFFYVFCFFCDFISFKLFNIFSISQEILPIKIMSRVLVLYLWFLVSYRVDKCEEFQTEFLGKDVSIHRVNISSLDGNIFLLNTLNGWELQYVFKDPNKNFVKELLLI